MNDDVAEALESRREYTVESQQVLIRVVEVLAREPLESVPLAEIAREAKCSRDQAFRCLWNLERAGWVERRRSGWAITQHLVDIALKIRSEVRKLYNTHLAGDRA